MPITMGKSFQVIFYLKTKKARHAEGHLDNT